MLHMCVSEDNKNISLQKRHVRWRKSNFQFVKNYYHMKIHGKLKQQKIFFSNPASLKLKGCGLFGVLG